MRKIEERREKREKRRGETASKTFTDETLSCVIGYYN